MEQLRNSGSGNTEYRGNQPSGCVWIVSSMPGCRRVSTFGPRCHCLAFDTQPIRADIVRGEDGFKYIAHPDRR